MPRLPPADRPRLLITGMGAVSPIGVGVPSFVAALREGRSGLRRLPFPEAGARIKSTVAAPVWPDVFDPATVLEPAELERLPRCVPMALSAARQAISQAGLDAAGRPQHGSPAAPQHDRAAIDPAVSRRYGLILGTGAGGIDFTITQAQQVYARGGRGSLWTITNATHGNLAGELSIRLGLRGPSWCVSTGCASSTDALGMALHHLRAQAWDDDDGLDGFVVVGADAHVCWETLAGMELLRVVSTRSWDGDDPATASRPFDRTRDGFILGEGAWAVVVEREAAWRRRGSAPAPGELMGYGATCDAFHRVRPAPDMEESARAMRLAVRDAGLAMEDIHLIHYHGTATRLNDSLETSAVKLAFGPAAPRLRGTSVKSMIGHPQGACGLASLVATLGSLTTPGAEPFVPPTINLREPDLAGGCDLDYTPLRPARLPAGPRVALINCLAFGAKNAAIVVRTGSASPAP